MKFIVAILCMLASFTTLAQSRLSPEKQLEIVEDVAKSERRALWQSRHGVHSSVSKLTKKKLDIKMKANSDAVSPLDESEVSGLYKCVNSPKKCSLFLISLGADYMGGYGTIDTYVLLDPLTGEYTLTSHTVSEE